MHQELQARVDSSEPNMDLVLELFEEYNQLTAAMDSNPALSGRVSLQALNSMVLAALTRKAMYACMRGLA